MNDYRHLLSPRTTNVVQDAGFIRRAIAFAIDILILDLIVTVPFVPLFSGIVAKARHGPLSGIAYTQQELTLIVLLFLIVYAYFVLFEYLLGQTLGMMLADTRIQGDTGIFTIMTRNSFLLPAFPFIILWFVEPFAIMLRKRSLLEYLTRTRTVHQRSIVL